MKIVFYDDNDNPTTTYREINGVEAVLKDDIIVHKTANTDKNQWEYEVVEVIKTADWDEFVEKEVPALIGNYGCVVMRKVKE